MVAATFPVVASILDSESPVTLATHTEPKPNATAPGPIPTGIAGPTGRPAPGLTSETVPSSWFATHTWPPPTATPAGPRPTGIRSTTCPPEPTRSSWSLALSVTHTAPAPDATPLGRPTPVTTALRSACPVSITPTVFAAATRWGPPRAATATSTETAKTTAPPTATSRILRSAPTKRSRRVPRTEAGAAAAAARPGNARGVSSSPGRGELEQPDRPVQVLELLLAQVGQGEPGVVFLLIGDDRLGRLRDQHLAAASGGADPRRPVHRQPGIPSPARDRVPGVNADPHPHPPIGRPGVTRQPHLDRQRAQHRLLGRGEGGEERVPLGVHLMAVVPGDGGADQPLVVGQHLRIPVAQRLDQPGRPLDISEQKRDRPARKPAHPATPPPAASLRRHGRPPATAAAAMAAATHTPVPETPRRGPSPRRTAPATPAGSSPAPATTTGVSPHASSQRRRNTPPVPSTHTSQGCARRPAPPGHHRPGQGRGKRR
jgi:hypothetical protein